MKDNTMKELPEGIPAPKEGWAYVGKGPIKGCVPLGYTSPNIASIDECEWIYGDWSGANINNHYAVRVGTQIARLNGIPDDYAQPKQAHNWIARSEREPTYEDYPIWFLSGGEVYFSTSPCNKAPIGRGSTRTQDICYTHWQPVFNELPAAPEPIKIEPEMSVMERLMLEERIRKAEEALDELRKKLGGAQ